MSEAKPLMRPLVLQDMLDGLNPSMARESNDEPFVRRLLQEQRELTAVEQFSRDHEAGSVPVQSRYYARLLPTSLPSAEQQYGFEVDLDRCSGCKACVTACHALNGLDDQETWRDVGLLVGGTESAAVMQHVTAACHHCLEPACMSACPVNAYEKDPITGIVRHLDDQCFGCQYCTLACPYNVPKYHARKGIVRKCDMCSSRLAHGEAPACVQACPHEAIAIRIVDVERIRENAEVDPFLPAAPEPHITLPTTTYKTRRVFPRNMLPVDYYSISPQHPHWPLVVMLVLTQLSVGAFVTASLLDLWLPPDTVASFRPLHATGALVLGLLALGASTCHLGRPMYAFRGILGFRHSWLSREIIAFGGFAGLAVPYACLSWWSTRSTADGSAVMQAYLVPWLPRLALGVSLIGVVGVICSAMIYVFTQRDLWTLERTLIRFGLTTAQLGIATTWLMLAVSEGLIGRLAWVTLITQLSEPLGVTLVLTAGTKLLYDISLLWHLTSHRTTSLKRSALLVTGPLRGYAIARVALGIFGGVILPLVGMSSSQVALSSQSVFATAVIALTWGSCVAGELLERYLFFAAVSSPRMPGGVRP